MNSAELRMSFWVTIVGMIINNISFLIIWSSFSKVIGHVRGWRTVDVVGMQGFVAVGIGALFSFGGGIPRIGETLASGMLDRYLLMPRNIVLVLATSSFAAVGLGDIAYGLICITFYAYYAHLALVSLFCIPLFVTISVWISLISGLASSIPDFFTSDPGINAASAFEIFLSPATMHGGAFPAFLRVCFTYVVPSLLVGAVPVEVLRQPSLFGVAFVIGVTCLWSILVLYLFGWTLRQYEGGGLSGIGR